MRKIARAAAILPIVAAFCVGMTSTAQAESDCTDYSDNGGAKAQFKAYGEHLLVDDIFADGNSAVGGIEIYGDGHYFYWNRLSADGGVRDVNLDIAEGTTVVINAWLGNWDGTVTGGIDFTSNAVSNCHAVA
ncbi:MULTISPECIES: hypothetical protein [Streptomyces]|jgi:hypothetical protein|uniref:Uncharacterized protein n=1 Tax=Streptomyces edwardsiae TaxID=3075527 RepID=A0ABU2PSE6_9ACTN|nr:hypothetical protein [Streptomyces sp. DSM 41636]MDT0395079.1 hypothetical protein [Streptomyces sp. DSM 41636]